MKVRVMVYRPERPYMPVAVSDEIYDLDGDIDDPEACSRVLARWRQGGAQARRYEGRDETEGLEACVVAHDRFRGQRMATAAELEKDFEEVKNRRGASPTHVLGVAKNVRDQIERVQRSVDLGQRDGVPYGELVEGEAELKRLRSLLQRIEADQSRE